MDFSSPLASEGGCCWSPCGSLLATCSPPRLTVWAADTLVVAAVLPCQEVETVDRLLFSPDSLLLLLSSYKAGLTLVYSVGAQEWRGRIATGSGGLAGVTWGADSRHVLTMADWGVLLTVWSLSSRAVQYVKTPKQWTCEGAVGNRDGSYSAVVERRECRDCLNIFTGNDWQLVRHTLLETEDCAGALWAPHRDCIAVWDSPLYYRILVVSLDGRVELDYSAYDHQLGVAAVRWSPSGHMLAIASHDNKVRLFCSQFWTLVHQVEHSPGLHEALAPGSTRSRLVRLRSQRKCQGGGATWARPAGLSGNRRASSQQRPPARCHLRRPSRCPVARRRQHLRAGA